AGGRYVQVVELLAGYWREHPKNIPAIELLARACANQGQLPEALAWCQKGLARDKLHLPLQFLRATILQEEGLAEDAITALHRVLYLDPHHLLAHFALGNIYHQQRRFPEADRHFAQALELLKTRAPEEVIPESEGITAGRLRAIIESTLRSEIAA
ncbi:MAG TPA: tetratricopeptide repeat protein, partial [Candidatus Sulfotelmatobacter sp.]|nr:tetratricopeptide repeat protein [Candidatus Sulfotelmatobacter sp.]